MPATEAQRTCVEFLRYAVVGGIAFLADAAVMVAAQELALKRFAWGVYVAVALGFLVGLTVNWILSLTWVFNREEDKGKGWTVSAFLAFAFVGILGLVWTEIGMSIGIELLRWNYMLVKVLVAGAVLAWNYIGRRILVFRR